MPENNPTAKENQDKAARKPSSKPKKEKNWLERNIHSVLAIAVLLLTFFLYWQIIMYPADMQENGMKEIVIYILGALTTISTQVVSYYFGSSSGSASKSEELQELREKDLEAHAASISTSTPNNQPSESSNSTNASNNPPIEPSNSPSIQPQ